jgi:hypothetical protein
VRIAVLQPSFSGPQKAVVIHIKPIFHCFLPPFGLCFYISSAAPRAENRKELLQSLYKYPFFIASPFFIDSSSLQAFQGASSHSTDITISMDQYPAYISLSPLCSLSSPCTLQESFDHVVHLEWDCILKQLLIWERLISMETLDTSITGQHKSSQPHYHSFTNNYIQQFRWSARASPHHVYLYSRSPILLFRWYHRAGTESCDQIYSFLPPVGAARNPGKHWWGYYMGNE